MSSSYDKVEMPARAATFTMAFEAVARHVVCEPSAATLDQCLKMQRIGLHANPCLLHREAYENCVKSKGHEVVQRLMTHAVKHCPAQMAALQSCAKDRGGYESCAEENRSALDCGARYVLSVVERHHRLNEMTKEYRSVPDLLPPPPPYAGTRRVVRRQEFVATTA